MAPSQTGARRATPAAPPDRRLPPDHSPGARLRWLRGLMRRPFRLHWRGGPRLAWVERRHGPAPDVALARVRADLRAELLAHADAALALRELVQVDAQLEVNGWAGLAALPPRVAARAGMQARMLAGSTGSAALAGLVQRLGALPAANDAQAAADDAAVAPRAPGVPRPRTAADLFDTLDAAAAIEVSELGEDDYAEAELAWANSQPAALAEAAEPAEPARPAWPPGAGLSP